MNRPFAVVLAVVAVDAAGIALLFPILPNLLRDITGVEEVSGLFGLVLALYALMQFVAAPVLGVLSDRYGRRPVLLLSLAGSTIDYLVMAFAPSLTWLLLGRAVGGLTAATAPVTTAYLTDITGQDDRARRFGLAQAFFGAGFVLGPVIGGALGQFWWRDPLFAAAALNAINLAMTFFLLPESHRSERQPIEWRTVNPLLPLRWALASRDLWPLLAAFLLICLVGQTYGTVWVLFVEDRFQWSATEIGLSLGLFGVLVALAQAFAVEPAVRRLGERGTLLLAIACESAALLGLAVATSEATVFAMIPLIAFGSIGVSALRAWQTRLVDAGHQGVLQGVAASLIGLASIIGPLVFTGLFALALPDRTGLVWLVGIALHAIVVPLVLRSGRAARSRKPS